jgi:serine/threonine protein kinase
MSIKVGDTVGDYQVIRQLGAGGMGAVYEVRHVISDRREAIKILLPDAEQNQDLMDRFLREIRLQARLSHPGIAALHTALRHSGQLLMVMEYVEGESLAAALGRHSLSVPQAVDITISILSALAYAHSRQVIHRDIKPANIMLLPDGNVKLLDFGIARPSADPRLTHSGAAIGSLHYMSPEQIRGLAVDGRSDLYSMGVTLYEMTTGTRPFTGDDPYSVMKAHMEQAPRRPDHLNPAVPPELSNVIGRALVKDATQRFQTAEEFSRHLQGIRGTLPAVALPVPSASTPSVTPRVGSSSGPALVMFEPEGLERLTKALALFVGPVAKILVSRASKKAASWDELYRILAAEVPAGRDRDRFLASHHG